MAIKGFLPSQETDIFYIIKEAEMDHSNFMWTELEFARFEAGKKVTKVAYRSTDYYFIFEPGSVVFSPGIESESDSMDAFNWGDKKHEFKKWLGYLKREINQPDLWAEILKYKLPDGTEFDPEASNEPFTDTDKQQILSAIGNVRGYIEKHIDTTDAQNKFVNEKLEYLSDNLKKQGRIDWKNICITVLLRIFTALALSQDQANIIIEYINAAVSGLVQLLPGNSQE